MLGPECWATLLLCFLVWGHEMSLDCDCRYLSAPNLSPEVHGPQGQDMRLQPLSLQWEADAQPESKCWSYEQGFGGSAKSSILGLSLWKNSPSFQPA